MSETKKGLPAPHHTMSGSGSVKGPQGNGSGKYNAATKIPKTLVSSPTNHRTLDRGDHKLDPS